MRFVSVAIAGAVLFGAALSANQKAATARDKVYSKEQAARGEKTYAKVCASCHDPAKVPAGKKGGPELVGKTFLGEWENRTLGELLSTTFLTMPNDGSVVLTEDETADVIAYVLQANGYPDGPAALKYDAENAAIIVK